MCVCVCAVVLLIAVTSLQEVPGFDSLWPLLMYELTFCSADVVTAAVSRVSTFALSSTDITMYERA